MSFIVKNDVNERKIINLYEDVLKSKRKWPNGYWSKPDAKDKACICIRYLFKKIHPIEEEYILIRATKSIFIKNKLGNMLKVVFNDDYESAITHAFVNIAECVARKNEYEMTKSELIKKISSIPVYCGGDDKERREILLDTLKLISEDLNELPKKLTKKKILEFELDKLLEGRYNSKVYKLVDDIIPGKLRPWQFTINKDDLGNWFLYEGDYSPYRIRMLKQMNCFDLEEDYWENKENRQEAFVWLLKEVINRQKRKGRSIRYEDFKENGLETLLEYYGSYRSVFPVFEEFMPNKARPWMFKETGSSEYWNNNEEIVLEAIKIVLESNDITKENILELRKEHFEKAYMGYMLDVCFKGYIYKAVDKLYPDEFREIRWLFKDLPDTAFTIVKNRINAVKWLISYIGLEEDILSIKRDDFKNNNLGLLLEDAYKGSLFLAINEAYPGKFSKEDFLKMKEDPLILEYEKSFGECKKLVFSIDSEESTEYTLKKLSQLFAPNPNGWHKKFISFRDTFDSFEKSFLIEILQGNIEIYEYIIKEDYTDNEDYEIANEYYPDDEYEDCDDEGTSEAQYIHYKKLWDNFCDEYENAYGVKYINRGNERYLRTYIELMELEWSNIMEESRLKSNNLFDLYCTAYNFLSKQNMHWVADSIYMELRKDMSIPKHYIFNRTIDEDLLNEDIWPINKKHPAYHFRSLVRCGEVELYRMLNELSYKKADYVWVFPFELMDSEDIEILSKNESRAFLIHFKYGAGKIGNYINNFR